MTLSGDEPLGSEYLNKVLDQLPFSHDDEVWLEVKTAILNAYKKGYADCEVKMKTMVFNALIPRKAKDESKD